ncbi:MAG TPA: PepSY domain-containing protein [Burkholderiaceae bacterium]|nr:PepSY domain-containing protein [Burkholderiaceae bacterium]
MRTMRMDATPVRALVALGFVLAVASTIEVPAMAAGGPPVTASEPQPWLSIGEVHRKLEAAGYRNVEKIEREHGAYEVRATDRKGLRAKLYVDPRSGEIVARRGDRRGRDDEGRPAPGRGSAAECNRRRCRDDLPQALPGAAASR